MKKLGIIVSEFNSEITEKLCESALAQCPKYNLSQEDIILIHVPGAVEIPLAAKLLCKKEEISAVVCLGAVIRGETGHYQFVCEQVSYGCQKVALEYEKPVIFGVLTTENEEQALARISKGAECVDAAFKMVAVSDTLK
jgi:6,7-dimethyl-8-ribityllumazine synthase